MVVRSGIRRNAQPPPGRKWTGWPVKPGTSACSGTRGRRSPPRRWETGIRNRSLRHRTALAQTNRTELKRGDLTGTDKEITIGLLEVPSGSTIDRQTHLGEEAVYV